MGEGGSPAPSHLKQHTSYVTLVTTLESTATINSGICRALFFKQMKEYWLGARSHRKLKKVFSFNQKLDRRYTFLNLLFQISVEENH